MAGRYRKADAKRRNRTRVQDRSPGPTPARARRVLCTIGLLTGEQAFGSAVVPRLDDAGRPWPPKHLAQLLRAADEARLKDEDVMRLWWQERVGGVSIPLDRLCAVGTITERQMLAGMRYARAAWRLIGLPWPNVEAVYRRQGLVPDERAGLMTRDEEAEAAADAQAEQDLKESARAVRVRCGEPALRLVGAVAIYLEDRWIGRDGEALWQGEYRMLRSALDAIADALRVKVDPRDDRADRAALRA